MAGEIYSGKLGIGNRDALWIFVLIQFSAYLETGFGCGRGDQLHNGAERAQWLAPPVDGDERKQTMLNFVPFAGSWRKMTNRNRKLELVGELLKLDLP